VTTPLALDFMVVNGPENRAVAETVQAMAAEAGFDLKIRVTEFATSIKLAEDGDFQLYLFAWSGRTDPDANAYIIQTCKAPLNYSHYCDPEVDALHQEARRIGDQAGRKAVYEKIAAKVLPGIDGGFLYLWHAQVLIALSDRVDGYKQMPDGLVRVIGLRLK
jgi:peptide/nickel transport system substrate-binding protein